MQGHDILVGNRNTTVVTPELLLNSMSLGGLYGDDGIAYRSMQSLMYSHIR